jgi:WD40 repeat protein
VTETYQHSTWIEYVNISQDGRKLISASYDKTVKVWNLDTKEILITLRGHQDRVQVVDFLLDDSKAITGSLDRTIKVWDLMTGNIIRDIELGQGRISYFAISNNKKLIACALKGGSYAGLMNIWDVESGELIKKFDTGGGLDCIKFSPNNMEVAGGMNNGSIKMWNIESGNQTKQLKVMQGGITQFSFSKDGQKIVIGRRNNILIIDLGTGTKKSIKTFEMEGPKYILTSAILRYPAEFTPDGNFLLFGDGQKNIHIIHIASESIIHTFEKFKNGFNNIALSNDGKIFVASNNSNELNAWDLEKRENIFKYGGQYEYLFDIDYSPDGNLIGCGLGSGNLILLDPSTGEAEKSILASERNILGLAFNHDGSIIATGGGDQKVRMWNVSTGELISEMKGHKDMVDSLVFNNNGTILYSGSNDNSFIAWDVSTGKNLKKIKKHKYPVNDVALSQDGSMIATGSNDGSLNLLDTISYKLIKKLIPKQGSSSYFVYSVAFSQDSLKLILGLSSGYMVQVDLGAGYALKEIKAHSDNIEAITYTPDGSKIISGSNDSTYKIWDASTLELIYTSPTLGGDVNAIAIHPDGNKYAVAMNIGDIFIFNFLNQS